MTRLVRLAVSLYPRRWRRRYAREFEALLEDVGPGWRELCDVVQGALTMQIRTLGTIPVASALAGALAGGIIAMRAPEMYASSGMVRVTPPRTVPTGAPNRDDVFVELEKALAMSGGTKTAASVMVLRDAAEHATLRVSYTDRDPATAQRMAQTLTGAIVAAHTKSGASVEVSDAALPATPVARHYTVKVGGGAFLGLLASGMIVLSRRARRRHVADS